MSETEYVAIRAQGLRKTYNGRSVTPLEAVGGVDLSARRGEVVLISGPNGSGKTTLLSLLGCLLPPSAGTVTIAGCDTTHLDRRRLPAFRLQHIGFVFQSFRLLDALTALENVELPLNLAGMSRPLSLERARGALRELAVEHRAGCHPRTLSGGEKQRVAIARALVNGPTVLLADEPTGSLDSQAGQMVGELLSDAAHHRGTAVIIVSHDPRISHHADRLLRMEDGHLCNGGRA
jgi:putative ABC transport system ATP-binding protein